MLSISNCLQTLYIWLQEANLVLKEPCEKVKTFFQAGFSGKSKDFLENE